MLRIRCMASFISHLTFCISHKLSQVLVLKIVEKEGRFSQDRPQTQAGVKRASPAAGSATVLCSPGVLPVLAPNPHQCGTSGRCQHRKAGRRAAPRDGRKCQKESWEVAPRSAHTPRPPSKPSRPARALTTRARTMLLPSKAGV